MGELRRCTTELVLTAMVTAVFTALRGSIFTLTMAKLNVRVRNKLFSTLLQQEMGFYDTVKTGDITSRLSADTTKMSDQISLNVNVFLRSVVQAIGVLFFMFRISSRMSVVTFTSVPAIVLMSKLYGDYYRELTKDGQKKLAAANSVAEEALGSMSTVKSFAAESSETTDYSLKLQKYYFVNQRMAVAYTVYAVMFTALPNLVTALVLFYGGKLVIEGDLQPGDLVSFMLFQQSLSSAFNTIGNIWTGISGALGAADKIFEYIGREPKIPLVHHHHNGGSADVDSQFHGTIDLVRCRLKYPSRPETLVLNNLTLSVRPGETIALVGPSGGGKSSCLRLINRLYLAEEGSVMLDGKDAHTFDHTWYHRKIAIVGQEPVLFGRSIRRNILYGLENLKGSEMEEMEEPTMDDVVDAAKLANAHDFIMSFPKQYLTRCGEKGVALSGGQKQRIAIARALIRKPSILLLDEATSALDTESEAVVQRALDDVMQSRALTCIVVAHRLSTVQNASRILVVVDGSVLEVGTHAELLAKPDSTYRKLVHRQLHSAEEDSSVDVTNGNIINNRDEAGYRASAKEE
jgi:ATP-binding cassette subfamily B (MDR/TAP) protein 9